MIAQQVNTVVEQVADITGLAMNKA